MLFLTVNKTALTSSVEFKIIIGNLVQWTLLLD